MRADGAGRAHLVLWLGPGTIEAPPDVDGYVLDVGPRIAKVSAPIWVRVPPMRADGAEDALARALADGAVGIVLHDAVGLADVEWVGARLAVLEARRDLSAGSIRVLAAIESPAGLLALPSLARLTPPRLAGLLLDVDRMATAIGCARDAVPVAWAGAQVVVTATAAGVGSLVDGASDEAALRAARRDGFTGAVLSDPSLIGTARAIFGPAR